MSTVTIIPVLRPIEAIGYSFRFLDIFLAQGKPRASTRAVPRDFSQIDPSVTEGLWWRARC